MKSPFTGGDANLVVETRKFAFRKEEYECIYLCYQCADSGEKFTTIFINNAIYGMTGGQMAPTTLIGQRATTAPLGRTVEQAGKPMRVAEMLSTLDGLVYAERVCVVDIPHLMKAKKAIKKAFERQMNGDGFTFIEVLAACPTNWGMDIHEANKWLMENMATYYPLGVIKDAEVQ